MAILIGIHPVTEALRAGTPIERILIARGAGGHRIQQIIDAARRRSIPMRFEDRADLDRVAASAAHQGIVALTSARTYATLDDVASGAQLLVLLDGVEDPHNLGAIIRTAHAAGAGAVVIPERRAAGLTEVAAKASAGALEYLPVARVNNLNRTLEDLKHHGYWIYGIDQRGDQLYDAVEYTNPVAFVFGGEGTGLHDQVRKHCDFLVRIPMAGQIASLNVSVAAGVILFEWRRRSRS